MLKYKTKNTICIVAEYYWSRAQSHKSAALGLWIVGQYKHYVVLGFLLWYGYGFLSVNPVFSDVGAGIVLAICELSLFQIWLFVMGILILWNAVRKDNVNSEISFCLFIYEWMYIFTSNFILLLNFGLDWYSWVQCLWMLYFLEYFQKENCMRLFTLLWIGLIFLNREFKAYECYFF